MLETPLCRVRVSFDGYPPLDYVAPSSVAAAIAAQGPSVGALVSIDADLKPGLRRLPCEVLWL